MYSYGCMTAVLLVLVIAQATPSQARPFKIGDLLGGLAESLIKEAFQTREIEILGNYCLLERQAYVKRFEVHYRAEMNCPGWTTLKGKGSGHTNATNSENDAIRDFLRKAVKGGLVTREDAAPWLDH